MTLEERMPRDETQVARDRSHMAPARRLVEALRLAGVAYGGVTAEACGAVTLYLGSGQADRLTAAMARRAPAHKRQASTAQIERRPELVVRHHIEEAAAALAAQDRVGALCALEQARGVLGPYEQLVASLRDVLTQ